MEPITFEQLPAAVASIRKDIAFIKELLQGKEGDKPESDQWFSLIDLREYLPGRPAKATIYAWVHNRTIPHKKFGKRLAFLKSEIDVWLKGQGRKTILEIEAETDLRLRTHNKSHPR
jgi:hypothetical protein